MRTIFPRHTLTRPLAALGLAVLAAGPGVPAVGAAECANTDLCRQVPAFTAAVADFRTSTAGSNRLVTSTLRFTNRTDRPLVLGYVDGSGIVTDDEGNRYNLVDVRALGTINRSTFDPKFTLQPGESADARLEFRWYAGQSIAGTRFLLDLAVREIDPVAGGQHRLGREHSLNYRNLGDGGLAAGPPATPAPASAPEPVVATGAAAAPPAPVDACAGIPRCYSAGPFTTQVTQVTASQAGSNHHVRVNLRFRNLTAQPLILGYRDGAATMIDNYGNRYAVRRDRVKGIGLVSRSSADPQFVLAPGATRDASFEYNRYAGRSAIGTVYAPDLAVEQLEILPSQQVRSVREYSLNWTGLTAGTFAADGEGADPLQAIGELNEAGRKIGEGLKSIFGKK